MMDEQLLLKKFIENNNEYFNIGLSPEQILELTQKLSTYDTGLIGGRTPEKHSVPLSIMNTPRNSLKRNRNMRTPGTPATPPPRKYQKMPETPMTPGTPRRS